MLRHLTSFHNTRIERRDIWETLLAALGVGCAILILMFTVHWLNPSNIPWFIVASLGSSALIIFTTPHAPMAQPWSVFAGQLLSATSGLLAWHYIHEVWLATAFAVVLASLLMLIFSCRHAPGAATALFIALGGDAITQLNWSLLWLTMLPALIALLAFAFLYNLPFAWRRYPFNFLEHKQSSSQPDHSASPTDDDINHEDILYAANHLKGYFELSEEDFMDIYRLAKAHHVQVEQQAQAETSMYHPHNQQIIEKSLLDNDTP